MADKFSTITEKSHSVKKKCIYNQVSNLILINEKRNMIKNAVCSFATSVQTVWAVDQQWKCQCGNSS